MNQYRQCAELDQLAGYCVKEKAAAPAAVVASVYRKDGGWRIDLGACGHLAPGLEKAEVDTVFDLASLTKPVFALAVARVVRSGLLDWTMPLDVLLRESHGTTTAEVPIELLLAHRSGLDAHLPLYIPLQKGAEINRFETLRQVANARRAECVGPVPKEGFEAVYSDLGYLLLGEAIARATGMMLDELLNREVCSRIGTGLGSARQWKRRNREFVRKTAPTQVTIRRGGILQGVVNDENAWAIAADGICAHAGLFGTAADVAALCVAILQVLEPAASIGKDWLDVSELEPLIRRRNGGTLRAGFDGKSAEGSSAGSICSDNTFGHLGFTGTSMWIDPDNHTAAVVLTNRVFPDCANTTIRQVRPVLHDGLFQWARRHAS